MKNIWKKLSCFWDIRNWIVRLNVYWRGMTSLTYVTLLSGVHWPTGSMYAKVCNDSLILQSKVITSPPEGLRGIVFTHSVCLSVCVSVCVSVCPANILVFYFSAIRRDIDLKFIQDTHRVVLNSLKNKRPLGLTALLSNNTLSMIYSPMNTKWPWFDLSMPPKVKCHDVNWKTIYCIWFTMCLGDTSF